MDLANNDEVIRNLMNFNDFDSTESQDIPVKGKKKKQTKNGGNKKEKKTSEESSALLEQTEMINLMDSTFLAQFSSQTPQAIVEQTTREQSLQQPISQLHIQRQQTPQQHIQPQQTSQQTPQQHIQPQQTSQQTPQQHIQPQQTSQQTPQHHIQPLQTPQKHIQPPQTPQQHMQLLQTPQHHIQPLQTPQHHIQLLQTPQHHIQPLQTLQHHIQPLQTPQQHMQPPQTPQHHIQPLQTPQQHMHQQQMNLPHPDFTAWTADPGTSYQGNEDWTAQPLSEKQLTNLTDTWRICQETQDSFDLDTDDVMPHYGKPMHPDILLFLKTCIDPEVQSFCKQLLSPRIRAFCRQQLDQENSATAEPSPPAPEVPGPDTSPAPENQVSGTALRRSPRKPSPRKKLDLHSTPSNMVKLLGHSSIHVDRQFLRKGMAAASKAGPSKRGYTLASKLIQAVFSTQELAASCGLGLKRKEGDCRQPLDTEKVNAVKDYTVAWSKGESGSCTVSEKDLNDAFTEQVSYARKKLKRTL